MICDLIYILTLVRICRMTHLLPLLRLPGRWTGHLVTGLQFWRSSLHTLDAGHRFRAVSHHRPHTGHTARLQPHATRHRTRVPHAHLPSEEITPTQTISNEWGIQDIIQKLGKDSLLHHILHHNEVRTKCKFGVHWGGPARFTYNSLKIAILQVVDVWYLSIISILYLLLFITISFVYFQFLI